MNEILTEISEIITRYKSGEYLTTDKLRTLLRNLSICHYKLTTINIEAYNDWTTIIYNRKEGTSVASARVKADYEAPELRMTRKLLETTKNVILAMQQEISILKNEI